jgi:hypothetical protein
VQSAVFEFEHVGLLLVFESPEFKVVKSCGCRKSALMTQTSVIAVTC